MSPPPKPVHVHVCIIHLDYYTKSTCNTCIYTAEIGAPHQKNKNNNNNPSQKYGTISFLQIVYKKLENNQAISI